MERQDTADFPYYFDKKEADDVCRFFPLALRHSKGSKFAGNPFQLEPWQVFVKWVLFGWKRSSDHSRRFRKAHISVGRKNGKSTDAAGMGLYGLTCDREPGAEIYVAATKKEQAYCVFTEAERMRAASPSLKRITKNHVNNLFVPSTNSFFRPTSSDRPLDGPNPHIVIFDELHAWTKVHKKFHDTMTTGGASRTQPLEITITTAGDDSSHIWQREYNACKSIVLHEFQDETVFVFIAEIDDGDDPFDPSVWQKANPNLGISVSEDYLREQASRAERDSLWLPVFMSKHMNKMTSSKSRAFDIEQWDQSQGELSDWRGADAIAAGVDMGGHDDLASWAMVARFQIAELDGEPVYRYEVKSASYICQDPSRDITALPFSDWIHQGYINRCEYPHAQIRADLLRECEINGCNLIAFDPANASSDIEYFNQRGFKAARMRQSYAYFNQPIDKLMSAIRENRFTHDGNPVLRWCAKNAIVKKNQNDEWMFDKASSEEKIDAIVAATMALSVASAAPERATGSLYL